MRNEFTAIIERDGEWFIAYCAEVPGLTAKGKLMRSVWRACGRRLH